MAKHEIEIAAEEALGQTLLDNPADCIATLSARLLQIGEHIRSITSQYDEGRITRKAYDEAIGRLNEHYEKAETAIADFRAQQQQGSN